MKFILSMIICSGVAGQCMPPYEWPETFNTQYDCLMFGYKESIVKMEKLGPEDVNKYSMFIKFYCVPDNSI
jgi:hypothetical protein